MTYNVLAQNYVSGKVFPATPKRYLRAPYRRRAIVADIRRHADDHNVDILCLQELQVEECARLAEELPDFDGVSFKRRTSCGARNKRDGCGLFWRTGRFEETSPLPEGRDAHVEFNEIAEDPVLALTCEAKELAVRDCVGALVCLTERGTGLRLVVGSAHLFWDPNFAPLKLAQAGYYRRAAFALAHKFGTRNLVLAGDWNSLPESSMFAFMDDVPVDAGHPDLAGQTGDVLAAATERIESDVGLSCATSFCAADGVSADVDADAPLTTLTWKFRGALDHIFFSRGGVEGGNTVLGSLSLPSALDFERANLTALPSEAHPSDHLPHIVRFALRLDAPDVKGQDESDGRGRSSPCSIC
jgi:CCR4-NOT transcription complex subunit 6